MDGDSTYMNWGTGGDARGGGRRYGNTPTRAIRRIAQHQCRVRTTEPDLAGAVDRVDGGTVGWYCYGRRAAVEPVSVVGKRGLYDPKASTVPVRSKRDTFSV